MSTHEDRKDFKCGVCGIENKSLDDLKSHLQSHEPNDAKYAHCCELCGKRYIWIFFMKKVSILYSNLGLLKEPTWMRIFASIQALSRTIATSAIRAFRKKAIWRSIVVSIRARGHLSANNAEPALCGDQKWLCTTVSFIQAKGPINVLTVPKTSSGGI